MRIEELDIAQGGDPLVAETIQVDETPYDGGDVTYQERLAKYNLIKQMLADGMSYAQIAAQVGGSRQNVFKIVHKGGVKPSGRPVQVASREVAQVPIPRAPRVRRSNPERQAETQAKKRAAIEEKILKWHDSMINAKSDAQKNRAEQRLVELQQSLVTLG